MNLKSADSVAAIGGLHLHVVIDHRIARIYKTDLHGNLPQCIIPYDANGSGRHLHYAHKESSDQRKPPRLSFYDAVAKTLHNAGGILLFGSGAPEQAVQWSSF